MEMRWLDSITELSGYKFEQTLGDSEGQRNLECCSREVAKNQTRLSD